MPVMNKQLLRILTKALREKPAEQTDVEACNVAMRSQGMRRAIWASYTSDEKIILVHTARRELEKL